MKVIDNNGRLFGKISVIDVLAILVVLALGAALYVKSNQPHTGVSVPTQTITYQVRVDGAPEYLQNSIHVGDAVELFGPRQSADALAALLNTIPYELTCAVSKRVPRLYLENGQVVERSLRLLE